MSRALFSDPVIKIKGSVEQRAEVDKKESPDIYSLAFLPAGLNPNGVIPQPKS